MSGRGRKVANTSTGNDWPSQNGLGLSVLVLGGFNQVVDVDVDVVVVFDVVHRGLGGDLIDDQARPLQTVIRDVLHLFAHEALWLLPRLPVCREQVFVLCAGGQRKEDDILN